MRKLRCKRCRQLYIDECACRYLDQFLNARTEISGLFRYFDGLAHCAGAKSKRMRTGWFEQQMGSAKTRAEVLRKVADTVKQLAIEIEESDERCLDNCKGMYFCELKTGHKGKHQCAGGALKW